jgi:signal transduction histidine kinase/CheY-like chemotaxis protein
VLSESDALTVHARIAMAAGLSVSLSIEPLERCADLPSAIIRYVVRVKETLLVNDAATEGAFAADPAVKRLRLRSVLCMPLMKQAKVLGVLYLQNDAMAGAFSDELVEVVQVLAAQAVISIENAQLHHAAKQEIGQRRQAEQALNEADRRKDEFLAMLAHELRNPLAPISNASEVLLRTLSGDDTRAHTAATAIKRQAAQLTRIVDDLLDVSRVTQGRIKLTRQPLDLATVITHAVETVDPLIRAKQHHISLIPSDGPLYADGDFARLVQCVGNVLTNAAKYTAAGGEIRISSRAVGNSAIVEIKDNGAGISPRLLPRVFDLFVQGDRTIDRAQGGLGVGLAVVKRLLEMHGGEVIARSDGEGRGSTFELRLPCTERPPSLATETPSVQAARCRVLVIDDNVDAAESAKMLLSLLGQEAEAAYSGTEALERLASFRPDLVLVDLGMPGMDGYEVARRIRNMGDLQNVRIVALSGYGQPEDRRRTAAAGFDDHLVKPVDSELLEQLLHGHRI